MLSDCIYSSATLLLPDPLDHIVELPLSEDKLTKLKEAIRLAPSSFNWQPWKIKIIDDKETLTKLTELRSQVEMNNPRGINEALNNQNVHQAYQELKTFDRVLDYAIKSPLPNINRVRQKYLVQRQINGLMLL